MIKNSPRSAEKKGVVIPTGTVAYSTERFRNIVAIIPFVTTL